MNDRVATLAGVAVAISLVFAYPILGSVLAITELDELGWAIAALAPLQLLLVVALFASELAGRTRPVATGIAAIAAAAWPTLFAIFLPVLLPVPLLLVTIGLCATFQRGPTTALPAFRAAVEARERFRQRRSALGRHYRWRVLLWGLPHVLYGLALVFLGLSLLLLPAGFAAGSPETAVIGLLLVIPALVITSVLPLVAILASATLTPLARGPMIRLLRALWPERATEGGVGIGVSMLASVIDLGVFGTLVVFVASTVAAAFVPGAAGGVSAVVLAGAAVAFVLRIVFVDVAVLTGKGVGGAIGDTVRLVVRLPSLARAFVVQAFGVLGVLGGVFAVSALVQVTAMWAFGDHLGQSGSVNAFVIALGLSAAAGLYVAAPMLLSLALYRLALLDLLLTD